MFINFSDIPGHQNLFLDYLYEFSNVKRFYGKDFRDKTFYPQHFNLLAQKEKHHTLELLEIIHNQYSNLTPDEKTIRNIESLKQKNTLAIVTGQQLGIFGGPLYTFYKILTSIKLSYALNEKYSNYNFVPVFWLEGDDHDFEEVKSFNLIDENNELVTMDYNDGIGEEINRGSVGKIKFNGAVEILLDELQKQLRDTEFKPKLMDLLKSFYKVGSTFKDAFKELIFYFFDKFGVIIFDPSDPKVKKLLKPIFKKEVEEFREHANEVVSISAKLEESYHAQVKARPINLFMSEEDGRHLIEPIESEFRLKGKRKKFSKETLLEQIEISPEKFSPNVLLRPICQDYLFRTAFYVGGPSEISYFAQVIPLYKMFDIEQPIIYPRSSLTIAEKNIQKLVEKFNLSYSDFFNDKESITKKIIGNLSEVNSEQAFDNCSKEITIALDNLKEKLFAIDNTLVDLTNKTSEKILQNLELLKERSSDAQKRKHDVTIRQINRVSNILYPNSNLQERELNFIYFANKYGLDIVKWMFDQIEIEKFEHQVTEL
ncbi:MAG: bacillithiol biosynthesis cysteine-adding enzyme BshC [Ignavibacteriales bacterium]|nr:bacillithiol biosynthesis cysteine-adding enzyme BshC [Ignavibacteriales bacterium]